MTSKENPEYEKIMWGNLNQKINVARIFNENMKLLEKIRDEKQKKYLTLRYQVTELNLVCSIVYTNWKYI